MKNNDDNYLLDQLKAGDLTAYEQLFKRYYKLLNLHAYYILKDEMEAEDQVQSLFIEIWDKRLYNHIRSSVKSYLYTAIKNKCLIALEKKKINNKRLNRYVSTLEYKTDKNTAIENESEKSVNAIINELPAQRQQAFSLVYLENKKYKEAARIMHITTNSVKTHLKLAMKELRAGFMNFK
jgi:RNA polymerase sigma-70 factor (ECF subfamily)